MNTKTYSIGNKVSFLLDGKIEGSGEIVASINKNWVVKLDAPCKEFPKGHEIVVSESEIV